MTLDAFNLDPTPGPRAATLHRLMRTTGLKRRVVFDELVKCDWNEDKARKRLEAEHGTANP